MLILPSKELIHIILGYEGEYTLEGNFLVYNQSDTYDACPDCLTRLPETSSCARSWKCTNPECQNSGDFEFYSPIYNYSTNTSINIYELVHMCKEWAFKQGYELFSRILSNDNQMRGNCLVIRAESDPETILTITNADTEPEAIFKACEWILKEQQ